MTEKTSHVENFARSAIAPLIRATVMIAKTAWKRDERHRRDATCLRGAEQSLAEHALEAEELERVAHEAALGVAE